MSFVPMETILEAMNASESPLVYKIDALSGGIGSVRGELGTARVDVMARIDRLQDRLVTQHGDDIVAMGAADHALRVANNVREEARSAQEQISALPRQIRLVTERQDWLEDRA